MTHEEIEKKALAAYPDVSMRIPDSGDINYDRKLLREGYIKALTDLNLDAIRGEAMHEIADRYESLPKIKGGVARDKDGTLTIHHDLPHRAGDSYWTDGETADVIEGEGYEKAEGELTPLINRLCKAILFEWKDAADLARKTLTQIKEMEELK